MAEKHEKLLSELEFRLRQLMYLCDSLKEENRSLRIQLEKKDEEVNRINSQLEQLNFQYNNLKFAKSLTGTDQESVDRAKKRLLKLVQDVDKCIALLKI